MSSRKQKTSRASDAPTRLAVNPNAIQGLPFPGRKLGEGPRAWAETGYKPTAAEVRRFFGPAETLGATKEAFAAMDGAMEGSGAYALLQHAYENGQGLGLGGQFIGYVALCNLHQNALMAACINTVADDMTRSWITLSRNDTQGGQGQGEAPAAILPAGDPPLQPHGGDLVTFLEKRLNELKAREAIAEAAQLTGWFGGCLIYIDTGEQDLEKLRNNPLNIIPASHELRGNKAIRFKVVEPINCFAGQYNCTNPLAPDYYVPKTWYILGREYHASRFIHVHSGLPPVLLRPSYNFFGIPHAQVLFDYLLHFNKCRTAAQELLTKFSLTTMGSDLTELLNGDNAQKLFARMEVFNRQRSNDGIMLFDKDREVIQKLETPLSGVTDIVRQSLEFVAAVNGTPAVKLLGISPSGFNATGESDIRNYYDHIAAKQEKELRAAIRKIIDVIQVADCGAMDSALDFSFNPLSEDDKKVKAEIQKVKADTMAILMDRGVLGQEEARKALAADDDSGFNDIDPANLPPIPEDEPLAFPETGADPATPGGVA